MKVVCIDNSWGNSRHLEVGEIYEVVRTVSFRKSNNYIILAEPWTSLQTMEERLLNKIEIWVDCKCFVSLDEWRESRIDQLLNFSK